MENEGPRRDIKHNDDSTRDPSLELQRQINNSIASHNRKGASTKSNVTTSCCDDENNNDDDVKHIISEPGTPPVGSQFEYLDHPADIILHSWGDDISHALSNLVICMFGYMTSLKSISINSAQSLEFGSNIVGEGHDLHSLIYSFLDEWLYNFHDTNFVPKEVTISEFHQRNNHNNNVWKIVSSGKGEVMDIARHPQGTEVKAITYSGMKVEEKVGRCDVYVVVDI